MSHRTASIAMVGNVTTPEPADAQRARRRGQPRLRLGQPVGGVPDAIALLGEVGEEQLAFVGQYRGLSGHGILPWLRWSVVCMLRSVLIVMARARRSAKS